MPTRKRPLEVLVPIGLSDDFCAVALIEFGKSLSDFLSGGCLMNEMQDQSDAQLLREFAERRSELAFREIVTRHTDLVYSAALRRVESSDLACDVAQGVFMDLAGKARPLAEKMAESSSLVG